MISDVLAGNQAHARSLLNEMLGRMYFSSGNNFEIIRTRAIELTALLSRAVVENSGDQAKVYQMTEDALNGITAAGDLAGLSYTLLEILDVFIGMAFEEEKVPDSPGLQKIAIAVGFENQSYFSRVFKSCVGISPRQFRDRTD